MNYILRKFINTSLLIMSFQAAAMSNNELIKFAKNHQITGDEPEIYSWNDEACGPSSSVLVKKINLGGGRVGAITFQGLCWGAVYSYLEMSAHNPSSIRLVSQIASGRSEHFENWQAVPKSSTDVTPNTKQMKAIADMIGR